jgi:hypothetical protein
MQYSVDGFPAFRVLKVEVLTCMAPIQAQLTIIQAYCLAPVPAAQMLHYYLCQTDGARAGFYLVHIADAHQVHHACSCHLCHHFWCCASGTRTNHTI